MSTLIVNDIRHLDNTTQNPNISMSANGQTEMLGDLTAPNVTVSSTLSVSAGISCASLTSTELTNAPFTVSSSTKVVNLNADQVDGKQPGSTDGDLVVLGAPNPANTAPVAGTLSTEFLAKAVPAGELVGTSATQDLTNKTFTDNVLIKGNLNVASDDEETTSQITCDGDIIGFSTSDIRLKKNVRKVSIDPMKDLAKIEGVRFEWIQPKEDEPATSVGLIAQQVRDVLPEAVRERKDGTLGVRYELVIPLLVESIKQLEEKVIELSQTVYGEP